MYTIIQNFIKQHFGFKVYYKDSWKDSARNIEERSGFVVPEALVPKQFLHVKQLSLKLSILFLLIFPRFCQ